MAASNIHTVSNDTATSAVLSIVNNNVLIILKCLCFDNLCLCVSVFCYPYEALFLLLGIVKGYVATLSGAYANGVFNRDDEDSTIANLACIGGFLYG